MAGALRRTEPRVVCTRSTGQYWAEPSPVFVPGELHTNLCSLLGCGRDHNEERPNGMFGCPVFRPCIECTTYPRPTPNPTTAPARPGSTPDRPKLDRRSPAHRSSRHRRRECVRACAPRGAAACGMGGRRLGRGGRAFAAPLGGGLEGRRLRRCPRGGARILFACAQGDRLRAGRVLMSAGAYGGKC